MKILMALLLVAILPLSATAAKKHPKEPVVSSTIRIAQDKVRQSMKDPDSVKFAESGAMPNGAVCGMVNAKNSYGGYTGMMMYAVAADGSVYVASNDPGEGDPARTQWAVDMQSMLELCKEQPAN